MPSTDDKSTETEQRYKIHVCPRCGRQLRGATDGCIDGHVNTHAVAIEVAPANQGLSEEAVERLRRLLKGTAETMPPDDKGQTLAHFCATVDGWISELAGSDEEKER